MLFLWLTAPVLLTASPTLAAPPKAETEKTVQEVTVTGQSRDGLRVEADRRSYGISGDLQTATGSIGDALRNVPSLSVDVQGNVSLRGDPNVTIMVDGQPSGQFRGEGRASALQNLPADQFERVEVITTPSAEFRPDGSGIINLISKKARKPGYSGTVRGTYGSEARYTAGASGGYNSGKFSFSGDASIRRDPQKFHQPESRVGLDVVGLPGRSDYISDTVGDGHMYTARGAVDYDLDAKTRIGLEVRANRMEIEGDVFEQDVGRNAAGAILRLYDRLGEADLTRSNGAATATYRRKFTGDSDLSLSLRLERTDLDNGVRTRVATRLPLPAGFYENIQTATRLDELELKADYVRPFESGAKLKVGADLARQNYDAAFLGLRGPAPGSLVGLPGFTNQYRYDFVSPGAYATYEQGFGKLTVLTGLRLQAVDIDIRQVTTGERFGQNRLNVYPSLHLGYRLNDEQQVSLAFSRRINRSYPDDLNPFRVYVDQSNVRQGNPDLQPLKMNSYEAAWQFRKGPTYYLATLYYRDSRDVPTDVFTDIGGGVLLRTKENLGERKAGGLELVANGKITPKLTYNVSGNVFWNEIDAGELGFTGKRSDLSLGGRGSLNFQITPKDFVQATGNAVGAQLTAQGRVEPFGFLNLGYRHRFTNDLSLTVTAQDVLKTSPYVIVVDTPELRMRRRTEYNMRAVFIGLTWTFGGEGKRPKDPGFDFGGGPPGG
ncbi:MAG: TonB-dependent receptor [Phenylobacterium sp.]|uniref:TonB-dependent receptor domain-containing protein n=1 Tax=Phenylobacterium sp. TaxID=1871053 RepID=UPI00120EBAB9|nr:TonB-dependent receptor [Phenylobacterium sp.]TAJ71114.1 MAG: TonB-dependent receptor [Phenylobacterium sp.]